MSEELLEVDFGLIKPDTMKRLGYRLLPGRKWRVSPNKAFLAGERGVKPWLVWRGEGTIQAAEEVHEVQFIRPEGQKLMASEKYVCGDYVRSTYVQTVGAVWVK